MWKPITGLLLVAGLLGGLAGMAIAGPIGAAVGAGVGLLAGGMVAGTLVAMGAFSRDYPYCEVHGEFDCPRVKKRVFAIFRRNVDTGELTDIEACSHFKEPHDIRCKKACVDEINAGEGEFAEVR